MALDDRDRTFEKALARHLRYSAPSNEEAGSRASSFSMPCPDPEILAAYHDGSLAQDERTLWKEHVLSCDRCQVVLEHLATPLGIAQGAQSEGAALRVPVPAARDAAPPTAVAAASASRTPRRQNYFWWLTPAGALAAAALVAFLVLRPTKPIPTAQPSSLEISENRQPELPQTAQAPPVLSKTVPVVPRNSAKAKELDASAGAARAADDKDLNERIQLLKKAPQLSTASATPNRQSLSDVGKVTTLGAPSSGDRLANEKQDRLGDQVAALETEMKRQGVAQQEAPAPVIPAGQAGYVADGIIPPPPPPGTGGAPAAAPSAPAAKSAERRSTRAQESNSAISGATETVEVTSQLQGSTAKMRGVFLKNGHGFGAPGGMTFWRVGPAGVVERSTDKGKDWTPQVSGVTTDLLTGSAPSGDVAWIVGSNGTILRTTDRGAHWSKLDSPCAAEPLGIRATDAMHAVVWFVADTEGHAQTFQTSDGGSSWTAAPQN